MSENRIGTTIGIFLAGLGIGAAVALLLAPTSGEEARAFLGKKADEGRDYVTLKTRQVRRQAEGLMDKARELVV